MRSWLSAGWRNFFSSLPSSRSSRQIPSQCGIEPGFPGESDRWSAADGGAIILGVDCMRGSFWVVEILKNIKARNLLANDLKAIAKPIFPYISDRNLT